MHDGLVQIDKSYYLGHKRNSDTIQEKNKNNPYQIHVEIKSFSISVRMTKKEYVI